jgi:hypothetical protein
MKTNRNGLTLAEWLAAAGPQPDVKPYQLRAAWLGGDNPADWKADRALLAPFPVGTRVTMHPSVKDWARSIAQELEGKTGTVERVKVDYGFRGPAVLVRPDEPLRSSTSPTWWFHPSELKVSA